MNSTEIIDQKHLLLKHPFNALVAGPSQSGKTTVIRNLLSDHQKTITGLNKNLAKVCWIHGKYQENHKIPLKSADVFYYPIDDSIPEDDEELIDLIKGSDIIIFDDLMTQIEKNKNVLNLFIAGTHHDKKSVFVIIQNFFHKSDVFKELRDNAHYVFLFNNPGDQLTPQMIGRRMYPNKSNFFLKAFSLATQNPHGYLLIDRHQETPNHLRLRSDIVPKKENNFKIKQIGYVEKNV